MSNWSKYPDLEPIRRLKEEGRELLGKVVLFTEKRDGENVSIWLGSDNNPQISSHHQETADNNIQSRMMATPEYERAVDLLREECKYGKSWILYGELLKTVSPTRLEPKRKHVHWVLFDMKNVVTGEFAHYSYVYQLGFNFRIPVVGAVEMTDIISIIKSELERFMRGLEILDGINKRKNKNLDTIDLIKSTNQKSVENFKWDTGYYFDWFKMNFEQFKNMDLTQKSPYYWASNHGTKEEKQRIWDKEWELEYEGTKGYQDNIKELDRQRDGLINNLGEYIYDDPDYEGITAEERAQLIIDYLKSLLIRMEG